MKQGSMSLYSGIFTVAPLGAFPCAIARKRLLRLRLTALPGALQVEQMARDWLAANVPSQTLFDTAIRPRQSLVLAKVLVP